MQASRRIVLALLLGGCVTGAPASSEGRDGNSETIVPGNPPGYFIALSATAASAETVKVYDQVHDAIDTGSRKVAEAAGGLADYLEKTDGGANVAMTDGSSEIECDRSRCLLKLASRQLTSTDAEGRLAKSLTEALAASGVRPQSTGAGPTLTRRYIVGSKAGLLITCARRGPPRGLVYTCDFDLDRAIPSDKVTPTFDSSGELVDCTLAPGTTREAQDAAANTADSTLLELTARGKAVGYLLGVKTDESTSITDLWLCGSVTEDAFTIDGPARAACRWVSDETARNIGSEWALEDIHQDQTSLDAKVKLLGETPSTYSIELAFEIKVGSVDQSQSSRSGRERVTIKLPKSWCP